MVMAWQSDRVSLVLRNLLFTAVMPGTVALFVPWLILTGNGARPEVTVWPAAVVVGLGVALYLWCLWLFATLGRGTPGPWVSCAACRRCRPIPLGSQPDVRGGVPGRGR